MRKIRLKFHFTRLIWSFGRKIFFIDDKSWSSQFDESMTRLFRDRCDLLLKLLTVVFKRFDLHGEEMVNG